MSKKNVYFSICLELNSSCDLKHNQIVMRWSRKGAQWDWCNGVCARVRRPIFWSMAHCHNTSIFISIASDDPYTQSRHPNTRAYSHTPLLYYGYDYFFRYYSINKYTQRQWRRYWFWHRENYWNAATTSRYHTHTRRHSCIHTKCITYAYKSIQDLSWRQLWTLFKSSIYYVVLNATVGFIF